MTKHKEDLQDTLDIINTLINNNIHEQIDNRKTFVIDTDGNIIQDYMNGVRSGIDTGYYINNMSLSAIKALIITKLNK